MPFVLRSEDEPVLWRNRSPLDLHQFSKHPMLRLMFELPNKRKWIQINYYRWSVLLACIHRITINTFFLWRCLFHGQWPGMVWIWLCCDAAVTRQWIGRLIGVCDWFREFWARFTIRTETITISGGCRIVNVTNLQIFAWNHCQSLINTHHQLIKPIVILFLPSCSRDCKLGLRPGFAVEIFVR